MDNSVTQPRTLTSWGRIFLLSRPGSTPADLCKELEEQRQDAVGLRIGDALLNLQGLGRWTLFVDGGVVRPDQTFGAPLFASFCLGVLKREACSPSPTSDPFQEFRLRRS